MKTGALVTKSWDDLVFENRNQEYGAYVVRKEYSGNLALGSVISISFGALLLLIPLLLSLFGKDPVALVKEIPDLLDVTKISPPPTIEPITQPKTVVPLKSISRNVIPTVTTRPVEDTPPTNVERDQSLTNDDGADVGKPGPVTNTGGGVVEMPLVVEPPKVVDFAEVMPAYEGGLEAMYKFIQKKMRYPASARRIGIEGTVFVSFVVNGEGKVVDVKIVKGISADCDNEAVRVISMMPSWKAGRQNHQPVSVRMTLPIKFKMDQ